MYVDLDQYLAAGNAAGERNKFEGIVGAGHFAGYWIKFVSSAPYRFNGID